MSVEVQILLGGYVFIVLIIVLNLSFYVLVDLFMSLFSQWDEERRKRIERKRNERKRGKTL